MMTIKYLPCDISNVYINIFCVKFDHFLKVLRITPTSTQHVTFLRELVESVDYDVWREPRASGFPVDIMCHKHEGVLSCETLRALLKQQGMNFNVMIADVEEASKNMMTAIEDLKVGKPSFDISNYQNYNDTTAWVNYLAITYSTICELVNVGTSFEGREIVGIRITGSKGTDSNKPGFWLDGGLHAREWITTATVSWMLDKALALYVAGDANTVALVDALDLVFGKHALSVVVVCVCVFCFSFFLFFSFFSFFTGRDF
jgi:hypothetical protein